nr:nucleolar and coiled-body phosphoprotein 1-like [Aegilops tauschii subsp. strangulata]
MANGLTGIDLVRCWVTWRVLQLSIRPGLMCEYTGELTDPQCHCNIEMTEEDINNMTKTLLNKSLEECSQFGLSPFCTLNEPPAADSAFWAKKLPEKPKKTRTKKKASKKPAKKMSKTVELFDLDDKDDDDESEDEAEASHADDAEGTSHSSSGDSTGTHVPAFKPVLGTMAKPSKKAKVTKTPENPSESEHQTEKTSQAPEATVDEPPPVDQNVDIDQMNVDPAITDPPSPIKMASPIKSAEENDDDVNITGHGYTEPGKPTVLSKHSAKEEIPIAEKGKWSANLNSYASFSAQEIHWADLSSKESQVADLQENIKSQQAETSKAKDELTLL